MTIEANNLTSRVGVEKLSSAFSEWRLKVERELGCSVEGQIQPSVSLKGEFDRGVEIQELSGKREGLLAIAVKLVASAGRVQCFPTELAAAAALACRGLDELLAERQQNGRASTHGNGQEPGSRIPSLGLSLIGRACIIAARKGREFARELVGVCAASVKCEALAICSVPGSRLPMPHAEFGALLSMACRLGALSQEERSCRVATISELGLAIGSSLCALHDVGFLLNRLMCPESSGGESANTGMSRQRTATGREGRPLLAVLGRARRRANTALALASKLPPGSVSKGFGELARLCVSDCTQVSSEIRRALALSAIGDTVNTT